MMISVQMGAKDQLNKFLILKYFSFSNQMESCKVKRRKYTWFKSKGFLKSRDHSLSQINTKYQVMLISSAPYSPPKLVLHSLSKRYHHERHKSTAASYVTLNLGLKNSQRQIQYTSDNKVKGKDSSVISSSKHSPYTNRIASDLDFTVIFYKRDKHHRQGLIKQEGIRFK